MNNTLNTLYRHITQGDTLGNKCSVRKLITIQLNIHNVINTGSNNKWMEAINEHQQKHDMSLNYHHSYMFKCKTSLLYMR